MKRKRLNLAALVLAALCVMAAASFAEKVKLGNDIAWVMACDSFKCCVQQAYADGARRLAELAKTEKPGTWCAVLDADETIISNVEYQAEIQAKGISHSGELWDEWCNRAKATALPGAREYCSKVRELGGRVIIITNREAPVRAATLKNLDSLGFAYDAVLFREGAYEKDRFKIMRRDDVEKGAVKTLAGGKPLPPLKILMLVGDQTHDLYNEETMGFNDVKDRFAKDLIMIPNPMYGECLKGGIYEVVASRAGGAPPAAAPSGTSAALTPAQAKAKIGEEVMVEGTVVNVYTRQKGPDMLNFDKNWREGLSVAIFKKEKFGDLKATYEGKKIRVTGKVTEYRGAAQIKVDDPSRIQVLE
jgi:5'-nucleotidase (lipoprotein e(P4) family)